jgi:transcriptional regulator NrdR family protein
MPRGRPYKCPYCSSTNTTSKGKRVTKNAGIRKIRYCKDCKRKFTPKNQRIEETEGLSDSSFHDDGYH